MIAKEVKLIEYSKGVEIANCLTHAFGAVLSVAALILLVTSAEGAREIVSAVLFGIPMLTVYTVSAVYHGLKNGETKRIARLLDHSAIPLLIAGTTTPYALIVLYNISVPHGIAVLSAAWFCGIPERNSRYRRSKKRRIRSYRCRECRLSHQCGILLSRRQTGKIPCGFPHFHPDCKRNTFLCYIFHGYKVNR